MRAFTRAFLLSLLMALAAPFAASAVEPGEMLADPALEARARSISEGLRCLVCQNQSIDDSDAALAHDLRVLVRERLTADDTDDEVVAYIVSRYGEFVLLRPRVNARNALLWGAPLLLLLAGGLVIAFRWRNAPVRKPAPLSGEEKRRLGEIIGE